MGAPRECCLPVHGTSVSLHLIKALCLVPVSRWDRGARSLSCLSSCGVAETLDLGEALVAWAQSALSTVSPVPIQCSHGHHGALCPNPRLKIKECRAALLVTQPCVSGCPYWVFLLWSQTWH